MMLADSGLMPSTIPTTPTPPLQDNGPFGNARFRRRTGMPPMHADGEQQQQPFA